MEAKAEDKRLNDDVFLFFIPSKTWFQFCINPSIQKTNWGFQKVSLKRGRGIGGERGLSIRVQHRTRIKEGNIVRKYTIRLHILTFITQSDLSSAGEKELIEMAHRDRKGGGGASEPSPLFFPQTWACCLHHHYRDHCR